MAAWQAFHGRNRQQKDILQYDDGIKKSLEVHAMSLCMLSQGC